MRILVCGSRHLNISKTEFWWELAKQWEFSDKDVIISGGAKGTDTLAEQFADEQKLIKEIYFADWNKHGKAAGPIRNKQMLDEGKPDLVIAFLAPDSKGTKNMIEQATKAGIPVKVINIEGSL